MRFFDAHIDQLHSELAVYDGKEEQQTTGFSSSPVIQSAPAWVITFATQVDETLKQQYFQNYFICTREMNECLDAVDYKYCDAWIDRVNIFEPEELYQFTSGPGAWLLSRLCESTRLTIWFSEPQISSHSFETLISENRIRDQFQKGLPIEVEFSDLDLIDFICFIFHDVFNNYHDFWLFDHANKELYCIHHHEKIVYILPKGDFTKVDFELNKLRSIPGIIQFQDKED